MNPTGIERFFHEAAYFAALVEYLIEHKSDTETDSEIADILKDKPFMSNILFGVLQAHS